MWENKGGRKAVFMDNGTHCDVLKYFSLPWLAGDLRSIHWQWTHVPRYSRSGQLQPPGVNIDRHARGQTLSSQRFEDLNYGAIGSEEQTHPTPSPQKT